MDFLERINYKGQIEYILSLACENYGLGKLVEFKIIEQGYYNLNNQ